MIKFKERSEEPQELRVAMYDGTARNKRELLREFLGKGQLNLGYHYILFQNGKLEKGIDFKHYACYKLQNIENSIYVLCFGKKVSAAQVAALERLADNLGLKLCLNQN